MNWLLLGAATVLLAAIPALAHHSFAMFDQRRIMTLEGTVTEFQWTNPHAFIELDVQSGGRTQRWAIELNSPNNLTRQGWRRSSLKAGERHGHALERLAIEPDQRLAGREPQVAVFRLRQRRDLARESLPGLPLGVFEVGKVAVVTGQASDRQRERVPRQCDRGNTPKQAPREPPRRPSSRLCRHACSPGCANHRIESLVVATRASKRLRARPSLPPAACTARG